MFFKSVLIFLVTSFFDIHAMKRSDIYRISTVEQNSILHQAVRNHDFPKVKALIKGGGDVNVVDLLGVSALHIAAFFGYLDMIKYLLKNQLSPTNINAVCSVGMTPLMEAVFSGHLSVVKYLVVSGADLLLKDVCDFTALKIASKEGHTEVFDYLNVELKKRVKIT